MRKTLLAGLIFILFLVACASQPQAPPGTPEGSAIVWERSGGIAGICQRLTIEWNGDYRLEDCSDQSLIREGSLPTDRWEGLSNLLSQFGTFQYENIPPQGSADMFTDQYTLNGTGSGTPTLEQQAEINEQLAQLATELAAGPQGTGGTGNSGIAGQVLIGPTCPVQPVSGPEATECADQPYQATLTILDENGAIVSQFETDAGGNFQISLPPGTYTVKPEPVPGSPLPRAEQQTVVVPAGEVVQITITYESGIR